MKFGAFLAPFHVPGENPTYAYQRDLQAAQWLDELGYDEIWFGEHHSGGSEIIGDPLMFMAHVAAQTKQIKVASGVVSIPYHNPLWLAERFMLLDHLTRGRAILGLGPGSLPTDASMLGIHPSTQRDALAHDVGVLIQLIHGDEPVTVTTDRYELHSARVQIRPFSDRPEIVIAAIQSPTGPRIAGQHGLGLVSIGATMDIGADMLAMHWDVAEQRASEFNTCVSRDDWRLVGPMFIAETKEQALEDCRYGINNWFDYLQKTAAAPQFCPAGDSIEERIAWVNDSGCGVIGTAEDAVRQIRRLEDQSNGGFGTYLMMAHEWGNPAATRRHYELFAQWVMPEFQGQSERPLASEQWAREMRPVLNELQAEALAAAAEKHAAELESRPAVNGLQADALAEATERNAEHAKA
ncbi:MAG: LLM class flavin-dependent oxidoreductase [Actinobacteria bacterium]|nr:LLM class flavin-dependent oxidoreductase [Actinomycetota bacterium]